MKLKKLLKYSVGYYTFYLRMCYKDGVYVYEGLRKDVPENLLNKRVRGWRPSFNDSGTIVVYLEDEER